MTDKSVRIHKVEGYLTTNVFTVWHVYQKFQVQLAPVDKSYSIEKKIVLSNFDWFLPKLVLLIFLGFRYIFRVKSWYFMCELYRVNWVIVYK